MTCYSYNKAINAIIIFNIIVIIIIIIIVISIAIAITSIIKYKSFTNNRKNGKKLQRNNIQNSVSKKKRVYKENEASNASNSTKSEKKQERLE